MKKKLLLLPVILFTSFLGSCTYRTEHIPLKDILTLDREDYYGWCYYGNEGFLDYTDDVLNIFKTYISDAEMVGTTNTFVSRSNLECIQYNFNISDEYKKMNSFAIYVFDNGDIETNVTGPGWPVSPAPQRTLYKISDDTTEDLFAAVHTFVAEREASIKEEREAAEDASTIDNFLTTYSNMESRPVSYKYRYGSSRDGRLCIATIDIFDTDGDILESLTDLDYKVCTEDERIYVDSEDCIVLTIDDSWRMTLDYQGATGSMYYEYKSKYNGLSAYGYDFKVNKDKVGALYDKVYSRVKDQIKSKA